MNDKSFELKEKAMDAAIALIFAVALLISVLIFHFSGLKYVASSVSPFLVLFPESVTETSINEYAGIQKTYVFDMTRAAESVPENDLHFYLRHTSAVVDIDGNIIFDSNEQNDEPHIGHTPGGYWVKIPINPSDSGKKLTITLTPIYKNVRNVEPEFLVIDRQMLLHMIVYPKEGFLLILGAIAGLSGLFLIILSLSVGLDSVNRRRLFYLGAISVSAGIWKMSGLSILPLIFDYYGKQKLLWYIGVMCYMLMLVLSLRLLDTLHSNKNNRIGKCCCIISYVITLQILILQLFNIVDLREIVVPFGIIMGVLHLITLIQKPDKAELSWIVPSFAALLIDALILLKTGQIHTAPVLISWIILNLFVRGFGYLRSSVRRERQLREKEAELRDVKIQTLINQIRPHFIFNTLASISMICDTDPKRAMELTANFNNYLQANFNAIATTAPVPFSKELEHTKAYLSIQKALYIDKLIVDFDTEYMDFSLPTLTLQPIVENSIKHGIGATHKPEHIFIRTRKAYGGSEIIIEDDGPGIAHENNDNEVHVGLKNVTERLQILCGGKLTIGVRPVGGTLATIFIPDTDQ